MKSGYKALVKLRDEKVIKAFGVGVNEWEVCEILAKQGDFDLFLLAGRYTLLEQESLESPCCRFARSAGSASSSAAPIIPASLRLVPSRTPITITRPPRQHILERAAKLQATTEKHGVKLVEAALRFPLDASERRVGHSRRLERRTGRPQLRTLGVKIPPALWQRPQGAGPSPRQHAARRVIPRAFQPPCGVDEIIARLFFEKLRILRQAQPMMPARRPIDPLRRWKIRIREGADANPDFRADLSQADDRIAAIRAEDIIEPAAGLAMMTPRLPLTLDGHGIGRKDRLIAVARHRSSAGNRCNCRDRHR